MDRYSSLEGQLVTVSIPDGSGGEHQVHGRMGKARMLSVTVLDPDGRRYVMESGAPDTVLDPDLKPVEPWVTISSETGGDLPAPVGARGAWGSQNPKSSFFLSTEDWTLRDMTMGLRVAYEGARVEPITEAGKAWIEANLTTYSRENRLREKLEALDPKLANEFEDVLYRVRSDARYGRDQY